MSNVADSSQVSGSASSSTPDPVRRNRFADRDRPLDFRSKETRDRRMKKIRRPTEVLMYVHTKLAEPAPRRITGGSREIRLFQEDLVTGEVKRIRVSEDQHHLFWEINDWLMSLPQAPVTEESIRSYHYPILNEVEEEDVDYDYEEGLEPGVDTDPEPPELSWELILDPTLVISAWDWEDEDIISPEQAMQQLENMVESNEYGASLVPQILRGVHAL